MLIRQNNGKNLVILVKEPLNNSCFFSTVFWVTIRGELRSEMTGPFQDAQQSSVAQNTLPFGAFRGFTTHRCTLLK